MRRSALIVGVVLLIGCDTKKETHAATGRTAAARPDDTTAPARAVLLAELRRQAERTIFNVALPVYEQEVHFFDVASSAVPGLTYHWATYSSDRVCDHCRFVAVAGERSGRVELFREPADWGVLTRDWRPTTPSSASRACLEVASATQHFIRPLVPLAEDTAGISAVLPELRGMLRRRTTAPDEARVEAGSSRWRVEVWALEPGNQIVLASRFRCHLPGSPNEGPGEVMVARIDSVDAGER